MEERRKIREKYGELLYWRDYISQIALTAISDPNFDEKRLRATIEQLRDSAMSFADDVEKEFFTLTYKVWR